MVEAGATGTALGVLATDTGDATSVAGDFACDADTTGAGSDATGAEATTGGEETSGAGVAAAVGCDSPGSTVTVTVKYSIPSDTLPPEGTM